MGTLHLHAIVAFFVLVGLGAFIYFTPTGEKEDQNTKKQKKNPLRRV
jgi:hypothetical protein